MSFMTQSDVADFLDVHTTEISKLFKRGVLDASLCPLRSGRRWIPEMYVPFIAAELRRRGKPRGERRVLSYAG